MLEPGTVVIVDFPGAVQTKRRPALVVSTTAYHAATPDVVLGVLTSQTTSATGPTDYVLVDWATAGLTKASAFRAFLARPCRGRPSCKWSASCRTRTGKRCKRGCAPHWR